MGNFSIIPRPRLASLVVVSEMWNHYAAAAFKSRQPLCTVPTQRAKRLDGKSKMNFVNLVVHGLSAISVYGELVGIRLLVVTVLLILGRSRAWRGSCSSALQRRWRSLAGRPQRGDLADHPLPGADALPGIQLRDPRRPPGLGILARPRLYLFHRARAARPGPGGTNERGHYVGTELELFAGAKIWKSYLAKQIAPYLGDEVLEVGAGLGGTTLLFCPGRHSAAGFASSPTPARRTRSRGRSRRASLPACCRVEVGTTASLEGFGLLTRSSTSTSSSTSKTTGRGGRGPRVS